jgi:hypothetical protein
MRRSLPVLVVLALTAGCAVTNPAATPVGSSSPTTGGSASSGAAVTPTPEPTPDQRETAGAAAAARTPGPYRVVHPWAVPSRQVEIAHPAHVPLRFLTEVEVGDHPAADPPYTRITFAFQGGLPTYRFGYVPAVEKEGSGELMDLPGAADLRLTFVNARTEDDAGRSMRRPGERLGYPTLPGYDFGGDFEGHVTFGLGIAVAAGSDQAQPIRVGESRRADGTHVVAVDVRR